MDINLLLEREQISLHNAEIAASAPARIAHEGLATAYGKLLEEAAFPHRAHATSTLRVVAVHDQAQLDLGRAL